MHSAASTSQNTVSSRELISDGVVYETRKGDKGEQEGLLVSGRWYPGLRRHGRMFWGLKQKNRFIPGVAWCGRFIPGLMTRRGFFPGIATDDGFTLGVIVAGIFMPGVVHGGNFAPGVERNGRFHPGCFNASRQFVPGRFVDGAFQSGFVTNRGFEPAPYEPLPASLTRELTKEGFGLARLTRVSRVGGIPIRGVVIGTLPDALVYLPDGLATTAGAILGGLGPTDDLTPLDPLQRLGDLGFELSDPNDPGNVFGTNGIVERLEKWLDDFVPGAALGENGLSAMGALADAMEGMAKGQNQLIDSLNQGWADYWNGLLGSDPGGMVAGAGPGAKNAGRTAGWAAGGLSGMLAGFKTGAGAGTLVGGPVGTFIGGVAGAVLGAAGAIEGGKEGAEIGGKIVDFFVDLWHAIFGGGENKDKKQKDEKKGGSTSQPGEDGQEGAATGLIFNPVKPIGPYISRKKAVIEIDHGESGAIPTVERQKAPIRITMTDTGAMAIVDYAALRKMIVTNPERGVAVGINPLSGETIVIPGKADWSSIYEQSKMPWWLEKVAHPLEEATFER